MKYVKKVEIRKKALTNEAIMEIKRIRDHAGIEKILTLQREAESLQNELDQYDIVFRYDYKKIMECNPTSYQIDLINSSWEEIEAWLEPKRPFELNSILEELQMFIYWLDGDFTYRALKNYLIEKKYIIKKRKAPKIAFGFDPNCVSISFGHTKSHHIQDESG